MTRCPGRRIKIRVPPPTLEELCALALEEDQTMRRELLEQGCTPADLGLTTDDEPAAEDFGKWCLRTSMPQPGQDVGHEAAALVRVLDDRRASDKDIRAAKERVRSSLSKGEVEL